MSTSLSINNLKNLIKEQIKENGPISFSEFMELALYHPQLGYYSKNAQSNDYYTNVDVHSIFGDILARFFFKEWKKCFTNEKHFYLVELGCGNGKLAHQILSWFSHVSECYQNLKYVGIEKSSFRRDYCKNLNSIFKERFDVREDFSFPDNSINGIIFSNEFFDALPFHRAVKKNGRIQEIFIDSNFEEILSKPTEPVKEYFNWLKIEPEDNCIAEVHMESRKWIKKIAKALRKGLILTIDYGYEAKELYSEVRPEGTAICHFRHQTNKSFYENLGTQDITSHVNFTALIKEAESWGIKFHSLQTQSKFVLENGLEEMQKSIDKTLSNNDARSNLKTSSAIKSLIHPEGMGGIFKVLIQKKLIQ